VASNNSPDQSQDDMVQLYEDQADHLNWELTMLKGERAEQDTLLRELDAEVNRLNVKLRESEMELSGV
jgi:hypothetical protein